MPSPLLSDLRRAIRVRHYSLRTERAYVGWVKRFIRFHGLRHPEELGSADISRFLTWLANERHVSASTQSQALSALVFLYVHVLGRPLEHLADVERARKPLRLPTVFSEHEVLRVLGELQGRHWLMAALLYGSGLRLMECVRLRVKDVDLHYRCLVVRDGKGRKDRIVTLADGLVGHLKLQMASVRRLHDRDVAAGFGSVWLPNALVRKYPNAAREAGWQFVFPAIRRATDPRTGEVHRHHVDPSGLQRAVRDAIRRAGIDRKASCHTFRHSFATHLLAGGGRAVISPLNRLLPDLSEKQ